MTEDEERWALGRAIRAAREKAGMSRAGLAAKAHMDYWTLVRAETGKVGLQDLQLLADILEVTTVELLRDSGVVSPSFLTL